MRAAGSTLLLADDTLAAARHAAAHGWISEDCTWPTSEAEKRADEGVTDAKVPAPGVDTDEAPTVVVDPEVKRRDVE